MDAKEVDKSPAITRNIRLSSALCKWEALSFFSSADKSAFPLSILSTLAVVGEMLGWETIRKRKQDIELSGRVCITQTSGAPITQCLSSRVEWHRLFADM